jgi:hypothetical protein
MHLCGEEQLRRRCTVVPEYEELEEDVKVEKPFSTGHRQITSLLFHFIRVGLLDLRSVSPLKGLNALPCLPKYLLAISKL